MEESRWWKKAGTMARPPRVQQVESHDGVELNVFGMVVGDEIPLAQLETANSEPRTSCKAQCSLMWPLICFVDARHYGSAPGVRPL